MQFEPGEKSFKIGHDVWHWSYALYRRSNVLPLSTRWSLDHSQIMQQNCGMSLKQKLRLTLTKYEDILKIYETMTFMKLLC